MRKTRRAVSVKRGPKSLASIKEAKASLVSARKALSKAELKIKKAEMLQNQVMVSSLKIPKE